MVPSTSASPSATRSRDVVVALLLLLSLGGSFPYLARLMNANERPRILQALAWVDTAELAVDGPGTRGTEPGIDVSRSPVDGRLYPNKPPGATVPAIVAYAGLRGLAAAGGPPPTLRGVTLASRLLGALLPTLVLLILAAHRLRQRGAGAAGDAAVVLLALATPMTSYARVLFGHSLAACLLFAGWILLWNATEPDLDPDVAHRGRAFAGGCSAGAAISVEYLAAFAGLPFCLLLALRWRAGTDRATLVWGALGALVAVAGLAAYHQVVFGDPLATGYHHVVDENFAHTHARGLLGLSLPTGHSLFEHLVSPWGGLLYWAPLLVLGLGFALAQWRALDLEERLATGTFLLFTLLVMSLAQTGGWRVGPRYLVLAMPFGVYGLARLVKMWAQHRPLAAMLLAIALASTLLNAAAANLFPHLIPHGNPWADVLLPLLLEGHTSYAIVPSALAMMAVPLAVVAWAFRRASRMSAATAVLGALQGLALSVALLALPSHPDADADLEAVLSIWEPDGPRPPPVTTLHPLLR